MSSVNSLSLKINPDLWSFPPSFSTCILRPTRQHWCIKTSEQSQLRTATDTLLVGIWHLVQGVHGQCGKTLHYCTDTKNKMGGVRYPVVHDTWQKRCLLVMLTTPARAWLPDLDHLFLRDNKATMTVYWCRRHVVDSCSLNHNTVSRLQCWDSEQPYQVSRVDARMASVGMESPKAFHKSLKTTFQSEQREALVEQSRRRGRMRGNSLLSVVCDS